MEVGAVYREWSSGGTFRQLNSLKYAWSALVSSSDTTYDEIYCLDMVEDYPTLNGHVKARGTVTRTISVSEEATIGAELELLGFSVGTCTSTEMNYRKTANMNLFYHCY